MKEIVKEMPPAPEGLKNQIFLSIWRNLDHSRNLVEKREEEIALRRLKEEKVRLGLPESEKILMIGEGRDPLAKLLLVCAIAVLTVSALGADLISDAAGFLTLAGGLTGILLALGIDSRQNTYFTNYRVLVSERSLFKRTPKWSCMHYYEIAGTKEDRVLFQNQFTLLDHWDEKKLKVKGLSRKMADEAARIISSNFS